MKVLLITHGFPPAQHAGVFRCEAFAKYLPEFGITPHVLCGVPGSSHGTTEYPAREDEILDPLSITRVDWKLEAGTGSGGVPFGRWLRWRAPIVDTVVRRRIRSQIVANLWKVGSRLMEQHRPELILASSPPVEALLLASRLGQRYGTPVVHDLRDPWTYFPWAIYRHVVDFWLELRTERRVLSQAAAVITTTPTSRELLIRDVGIDEKLAKLIPNGFDDPLFKKSHGSPDPHRDRFVIAYTGQFSPQTRQPRSRFRLSRSLGFNFHPLDLDFEARSPRCFLDATERLLRRRPELRDILRVVIAGKLTADNRELFDAFPFPQCLDLRGSVSAGEANQICAEAQLLLLLQIHMSRNGQDLCACIPGKMYNYLRSGTRILAPLQQGDARDFIVQTNAGVVVPPHDAVAIETAIENEIDVWRTRGKSTQAATADVIHQFARKSLTQRLSEVLWECAERGAPVT